MGIENSINLTKQIKRQFKIHAQPVEMAHSVKGFASKFHNWSLIPGAYTVEGENRLSKVVL